MKVSLEKKFQNKEISEEDLNKYKKQVLIKKLVLEAIYILMIVISFVRIGKNAVFYNVLGDGNFFSFYGIALVLFFVTMYAMFFFNTSVLLYVVYKIIKKENYIDLLHIVNTKLDILTFIFKCLSMILFVLIYVTTPCTVVGSSMGYIDSNNKVGTLFDGDKLLCIDIFYTPKKDDIVVFDAKNYTNDNSFYIKRVLGVNGTVLVYSSDLGVVYIDGVECYDISKSQFDMLKEQSDGISNTEVDNEFTVPNDYLLCLGDNRNNSLDSRSFGLVKREDVLGKVYFRMFPLNNITFF